MCGIVGYVGSGEASRFLIDGLRRLEYRGYDSAGIAIYDKGTISIEKKKGRLANLVRTVRATAYRPGAAYARSALRCTTLCSAAI